MSQESRTLSPKIGTDVPREEILSQENVEEYNAEDFNLLLGSTPPNCKTSEKKLKRHQGIIGLIKQNPSITMVDMAEKLDVHERTIKRDIEELKNIVEHIGPTKGGSWRIIKK